MPSETAGGQADELWLTPKRLRRSWLSMRSASQRLKPRRWLITSSGVIFTGTNPWLKGLNGLAIVYDLLTAFIASLDLIYYGHVVGVLGWLVLIGLTLFVSGSSVTLALLSKRANLKVFSELAV